MPDPIYKQQSKIIQTDIAFTNQDGKILINRNWIDPRINFKQGGKLIPRKFQFGGYIDDAGKRISRFVDNSELLKKGEKSLSYLNYLSPTAVIGAVGRKLLGDKTKFNDLVLKGTGVVSQAFETENPLLALGINLGLDMLVDPFAGATKLSKLNKLKKVSKLDSTTDFTRITEKEAQKFAELKSKGFKNLTKSEKAQFQDLSVKLVGDFKYTGTKHSFKEIVNQDGTINFENASKILSEIETNIQRPIPLKNITPLNEISNANKKRHIEAGTTDVLKHIAAVGEAAQSLGLTKSFTKQEFIFGALAHDIGKMITEEEHIHGPVGAKLLQQIFPDTPKKIIDAVSNHMSKHTFVNDLQKAIHAADIANGKITNIEELFSKYPSIQYESTLYFKPTFSKRLVTKDGKKEYKTVQDNLRTTAAKKGIIPRITTSEVDYNIIPNSSGETFRFADLNSEGVPLLTTKNGLMTNDDYMKQLRIDLEKSGAVDKSGVYVYKGRKYLAGVPIYNSKTIQKIAKKINSNSSEIKKLRDAVREGNSNAAHVLFNLKYATQHELTGIEMVGGGTFGKPILRGHRLTPGQISEMVDQWKQGYTGMVAPVIKGSANFLGRNEGFKALSQFGSKLFVSDSPLTALRYSDIRVLEKNTTREMLLEGLSDKDRKSAEVLMDKILNYAEKYGIKQGDWDYSWLSKKNREGTYENIKAELYEKHPKALKKLISMYDDLQHILGNRNLGVGGTRRGIALIKPNIVANDYNRRSYHSWLSKNHPFRKIFKGGDHNLWTELLNQLNIRQGMTANIGETYKAALEKGAPYGINYMIHPQDFIVSRYKSGKKLIPRKFQFGGFNRPIVRQDNTRVVQQAPRMKIQTPRKVTRPSYNFENQNDRVKYAMQRLTSEGKFTKNQAAALLGVYLDENGLNPKTVQGKEKAGRGVKGTRGTNEYGAGPWSWTGPLKKQLLKNMGYSEDTLFENLPFNVQVDGLIASTKSGPLKSYFDTLRKYNGESASLLATIMTGGVGYLRNWNNPTLEELRSAANNMQNAYIRTNGKSDYTLNAVQRRLDNMNTILTTY